MSRHACLRSMRRNSESQNSQSSHVNRGPQLATKFGILNALYLGDPDGTQPPEDVPNTLTPVNNWRVIFSRLEGRTYPLQPDRHFIFPTEREPYNSIDITEQLNGILRWSQEIGQAVKVYSTG